MTHFAGSPNVRFRDVCTRARDDDARASIARTRRTMRAREKNMRDYFSPASLDSFRSRARERARLFSARTTHRDEHHPRDQKEGREKEVKSQSEIVHTNNARLNDARSKNHALLRTRTRTHPSTLPRSTIFTAQNVGDIAEKRDAQYRRRHRRVSRHHHGDGTRRERKFPKVRRGFWTVLLGRECPRGHRKRRFFSTRFFFSSLLKFFLWWGVFQERVFFFSYFSPRHNARKANYWALECVSLRGHVRLRRKQHALTPPTVSSFLSSWLFFQNHRQKTTGYRGRSTISTVSRLYKTNTKRMSFSTTGRRPRTTCLNTRWRSLRARCRCLSTRTR